MPSIKKETSLSIKSEVSDRPIDYPRFISSLKEKIRSAQLRASLAVNRELIFLYWEIGKDIVSRQEKTSPCATGE